MSKSKDSTIYKIICVPRASPRLADLVIKSRSTRLHALETDPTSFLSQHAIESALPLSVWHKRLSNPETTILACVATTTTTGNNVDDETTLLEGQWVGFAAVRGPMKYSDYYVTPDMNLPIPENPHVEARWHVYDLYTLPAHRGRGLAKLLVNACIDTAVQYTRLLALSPRAYEGLRTDNGGGGDSSVSTDEKLQFARIRLFMDPKNAWLITVYENLGFRGAGRVTLEEGFRANALDESVPDDTRVNEEMERLWHARFGVAMEQVVGIGEDSGVRE